MGGPRQGHAGGDLTDVQPLVLGQEHHDVLPILVTQGVKYGTAGAKTGQYIGKGDRGGGRGGFDWGLHIVHWFNLVDGFYTISSSAHARPFLFDSVTIGVFIIISVTYIDFVQAFDG
jgi:hypothetical protein